MLCTRILTHDCMYVTSDASDIEDTQDLATALQEVRIYENRLATKTKKRRLERKQTLSNGEVSRISLSLVFQ